MVEWFKPADKMPEDGQECLLMPHEARGQDLRFEYQIFDNRAFAVSANDLRKTPSKRSKGPEAMTEPNMLRVLDDMRELAAENERLRNALKPFADLGIMINMPADTQLTYALAHPGDRTVKAADFRRAREALENAKDNAKGQRHVELPDASGSYSSWRSGAYKD